MTDQLYLSIWLDRASRPSRTKYFEKLLRLFPFSQREGQGQTTVGIYGVSSTEPPLLEHPLNGPFNPDEALEIIKGHAGDDIAYSVETFWDLWQHVDGDWKLLPARVTLSCYGPTFDNGAEGATGEQEDLRVDFGVDAHYLPDSEISGSARLIEQNIKSLLRLVHEIDSTLPVEKRKLETESGENFADKLQQVLSGGQPS